MHWDKRTGKLDGRQPRVTSARANLLINGDFQIAQRGVGPFTSGTTPVNNNDGYFLDQWNYLANGSNTCNISQDTTDTPTGASTCMLLTVVTGNRKFGAVNFLENKVAARLANQTVALSFKAKVTGSSISNIRAAVVSWTSTADAITSDVVSSWGAAGTNPSLAANWTYENTADNLPVSTTWTSYSIENVLVDSASMTNVGVFIWVDDTDATAADALRLGDVKLEIGANATDFLHDTVGTALVACQRHLKAWISTSTVLIGNGMCQTTTLAHFPVTLPTTMRAAPSSITVPDQTQFQVLHQATLTTTTGLVAAGGGTPDILVLDASVSSGLTAGEGVILETRSSGATIIATCEL